MQMFFFFLALIILKIGLRSALHKVFSFQTKKQLLESDYSSGREHFSRKTCFLTEKRAGYDRLNKSFRDSPGKRSQTHCGCPN